MTEAYLRELLLSFRGGDLALEVLVEKLKGVPYSDLGYARPDHHRELRTGYPEVILCQGKRIEHIVGIVERQVECDETVLGTRAGEDVLEAVALAVEGVAFDRVACCFWRMSSAWRARDPRCGTITIVTAGTADAAVAAEARCTLEVLGHRCTVAHDAGVAGIHRLLALRAQLDSATAVIVIAGMEGALPSVVAGMVRVPVIAVPTSVGYGSHFGGVVPLLAMLNSCASGLSVVNIDNGFGAACVAAAIADQRLRGAQAAGT